MSRHAYMIIAHNHTEQLKRLLRVIDDDDNDIYLHIDKKWRDFQENDVRACVHHSALFMLKRTNVVWGDFSQIRCELLLLEAVVKHGGYSYVHLLSGSDFCLRSQDEIHDFFDRRYPQEFVYYDRENNKAKAEQRCREYHFLQRFAGKKSKERIRRFESGLIKIQNTLGIDRCAEIKNDLGKGSNWFSITMELAREVVAQEKFIRRHFRWTVCCDEVFLHTVLNRSHLSENLYHPEKEECYIKYGNMRYTDWQRGDPYIFRLDDFDMLMNTNCLFARKFDETVDSAILDKLESYIGGKRA